MSDTAFVRATSVDDAIAALKSAAGDGIVVAGGIVVGSLINQRLASPGVLVDISRIACLRRIEVAANGELVIGALTTHDEVLRSPAIKAAAPLLVEIASEIACRRLRNRGTLGGSLCTIGGQGDPATGLIALGARLRIRGTGGSRELAVEDFYKDPFKVDLADDEILEEVRVNRVPAGSIFGFNKIGPRGAMDWTQITTSVELTLDPRGERILHARIGMNGVGATPVRPRAAEAVLLSKTPRNYDWRELGAVLEREIEPQGDLVYSANFKKHLGAVSLRRAVERACASAMSGSA